MKYIQTRPSSPPLVTFAQMQAQLRIDTTDEQTYITDVVDACTEFAEQALDSSLLTRTITAIYFAQLPAFFYTNSGPSRLFLPRGPVQSITSVIDAHNTQIGYQLERHGHADELVLTTSYTAPLTVVYVAGYGADASFVPADIKMAIRTHVATLHEHRESIEEGRIAEIPHSLAAFYNAKKRTSPVA